MAFDVNQEDDETRKVTYGAIVNTMAKRLYKFKQAVTIDPSSAFTNYFYREDPTVLTGTSGNAVSGVPPLANFPQATVLWERVASTINKHGLEDTISWEALLTSQISIRDRTLFKIAEGVVKSVDDTIWAGLGGTGTTASSTSTVSSFSVVGRAWNASSATIFDDLMRAKQIIGENNYPSDRLLVYISERDHRSLVKFFTDKGTQWPDFSSNLLEKPNGMVGKLGAFEFIVSNSVTASNALIVVPQICGTWREIVPLTTDVKEDPLKSIRIRCAEIGVLELHNPLSVVRIMGTQDQFSGS